MAAVAVSLFASTAADSLAAPVDEASAIAEATRVAGAEVESAHPRVVESLAPLLRDLTRCEAMEGLRGSRDRIARDLLAVHYVSNMRIPIVGALKRFVRRLEAVGASDRALGDAITSWGRLLARMREVHAPRARFCKSLERWRAHGYSSRYVPVSKAQRAAYRRFSRAAAAATSATHVGAVHLRRLGVDQETARLFTYQRLMAIAEYGRDWEPSGASARR